jgi:hypothetical protein
MAVTKITRNGIVGFASALVQTTEANAGDNLLLNASDGNATNVNGSILSETDNAILVLKSHGIDFKDDSMHVESGSTLKIDSGATITNSGTSSGFGATISNDANNRVITADGSEGLNGEANLTFDGNALVVKGTSPSITIGDAGAEDTKIVFDGNAQDYYMGLDDTDDDFKIGLGSAVGTTAHMVFDEAGAVTKPLQPCVLVHPASQQDNFAANTQVTIIWGTEVFDVGGDFASNTFTAPVTGKYFISVELELSNIDTAANYYNLALVGSNRTLYSGITNPGEFNADFSYWPIGSTIILDMDTSDTFSVQIREDGGSVQTDIRTTSYLSIALLG